MKTKNIFSIVFFLLTWNAFISTSAANVTQKDTFTGTIPSREKTSQALTESENKITINQDDAAISMDEEFSVAVVSDPQFFWTEIERSKPDTQKYGIKFNDFTANVINKVISENDKSNWKGVVINGDLTAFGHGNELAKFKDYYNKFNVPVYIGLGNHDYANNVNNCADNGCASDMVRYLIGQVQDKINSPQSTIRRFDYIRQNHPGQGLDVFKGSMSYSWGIGKVHFVQLNNYPAYNAGWESSYLGNAGVMRIKRSLKWLRDDLSKAIHSDRAETIILNMHQFNDSEHWNPFSDIEFRSILKDFPVTAIFAGHTHSTSRDRIENVPVYRTGASHGADFTLLNFKDNQMHITIYDAETLYDSTVINSIDDYPTPFTETIFLRTMNPYQVPLYSRPEIIFYDSSTGRIDNPNSVTCYFSDIETEQTQIGNIKNEECFNDDARSVELKNIKEGTVVKVYDSPNGSLSDDYSIIKANKDINNLRINSLEMNIANNEISMVNIYNNGLNGKVSRFEVYPPNTYQHSPQFVLYEGNSGNQNIVCTLPGNAGSVNFQNNNYGCDNDETRSVKLIDVPKNSVLTFYDHPDGRRDKDYVVITVKNHILGSYIIKSYEQSYSDEYVSVVFYKKDDGKLDGKVSRAEISLGRAN